MADNFREGCSNPNPGSVVRSKKDASLMMMMKKKKNKETSSQFEFCKVCRLNHEQGQRHKYFPSHKNSLSTYLSRFESKLEDVRFFLRNPIPLRPEFDSQNRFWCIFCDVDVLELGSPFACKNAIIHLSSADHLKNLKHFFWKYGGGTDRLDSFRILDADVTKWQKKCAALKKEASLSEERCDGLPLGLSNDIHREPNIGIFHHFENSNNVYPPKLNILNGVTPLQYSTGEHQISHPEIPEGANAGYLPTGLANASASLYTANNLNASRKSQHSLLYRNSSFFTNGHNQVYQDGGLGNGESDSHGAEGNVHSGAAPPWLNSCEHNLVDYGVKSLSVANDSVSNKPDKSRKLNPKRVGAAWAEKRKIEMELERRGEISKSECDSCWLPNFGRVWQSGSRKESRKEFETEKQKLLKVETQFDVSKEIKPYISKRIRKHKDAAE